MAMTDLSFGVRGNCSMCKNTIERAANGIDGVASANWDVDKKKIDVSFYDTKTDAMAIHKAIAASGYDTEKVVGSEEAYNGLPGCCKYDHEMAMNQTSETKSDNH
jgi:copper chaperone CopZ